MGACRRGVCVRTVKSKQTYTLIMLTQLNPGFSVHSRYIILAFVPVSFRTDFKVLLLVIKCLHLLVGGQMWKCLNLRAIG